MKFLRLHTDYKPTKSEESEVPCPLFQPNEKVSVREFFEEYTRSGVLPSRRLHEPFGDNRTDDEMLDDGHDIANRQFIDPLEAYVDDVSRREPPKSPATLVASSGVTQ